MTPKTIGTFNCVIFGDPGVGKTNFVNRQINGSFEKEHKPTLSNKVQYLHFDTSRGRIIFKLNDITPYTRFGGIRRFGWKNIHCCVLMFDLGSLKSYNQVGQWHQDFVSMCGGLLPTVLVGNKCDLKKRRQVEKSQIGYPNYARIPYYEISVKKRIRDERPLLMLSRYLVGDSTLRYIDSYAPEPPLYKPVVMRPLLLPSRLQALPPPAPPAPAPMASTQLATPAITLGVEPAVPAAPVEMSDELKEKIKKRKMAMISNSWRMRKRAQEMHKAEAGKYQTK